MVWKTNRGEKSGKVRTPTEMGKLTTLAVNGSPGSLAYQIQTPTMHTSSKLPRRNVGRVHCSAFVSCQRFPLGSFYLLSHTRGTSSWPRAPCHVPPIHRLSSSASQDATECLNTSSVTVAYIPFHIPRIHRSLLTPASSEADTTCKRPSQLAILATHSRPDPSVDRPIGKRGEGTD